MTQQILFLPSYSKIIGSRGWSKTLRGRNGYVVNEISDIVEAWSCVREDSRHPADTGELIMENKEINRHI